jgi:hypothetical protein
MNAVRKDSDPHNTRMNRSGTLIYQLVTSVSVSVQKN